MAVRVAIGIKIASRPIPMRVLMKKFLSRKRKAISRRLMLMILYGMSTLIPVMMVMMLQIPINPPVVTR